MPASHKKDSCPPCVKCKSKEINKRILSLLELIKVKEQKIKELTQQNISLREKAFRDHLTGAYNRALLIDEMERFNDIAKRSDVTFVIFFVDLDWFKQINDTFGHLVGDIAISSAAQAIRKVKRKTDIFFRYGGDEFVLLTLLKNKIPAGLIGADANKIRDRIEREVRKRHIEGYEDFITLSASVGFHMVDKKKNLNPTTLLKLADRALYERKQKKKAV